MCIRDRFCAGICQIFTTSLVCAYLALMDFRYPGIREDGYFKIVTDVRETSTRAYNAYRSGILSMVLESNKAVSEKWILVIQYLLATYAAAGIVFSAKNKQWKMVPEISLLKRMMMSKLWIILSSLYPLWYSVVMCLLACKVYEMKQRMFALPLEVAIYQNLLEKIDVFVCGEISSTSNAVSGGKTLKKWLRKKGYVDRKIDERETENLIITSRQLRVKLTQTEKDRLLKQSSALPAQQGPVANAENLLPHTLVPSLNNSTLWGSQISVHQSLMYFSLKFF
eukprot:TRINITY_DN25060_c0_g1_i2.p1 TRINITY_DN25060_c0_g1~~TRINITY_DN25060_c0_g1_i2.p1  ORF type:complete len:300 (+),score=19.21 TRINITY_DN25060_c0_g1_i2:60-902(+)